MSLDDVSHGRERRRGFDARRQLRVVGPLLAVWAAGFAVLAAVAVRGDVGDLLLDPAYASGGQWYMGAVSQLGVLAWTTGVGAAWGGRWIAGRTGRDGAARFLGAGAGVGAVLLADDLFGVHANVLAYIGVPKHIGEIAVVTPLVVWLLSCRADIARTRWQVLACSLLGLAGSAIVDAALDPRGVDIALLAEDGPKFLGVLAWATYFVLTARDIAASAIDGTRRGVASGDGRAPTEAGGAAAQAGGAEAIAAMARSRR